MKNKIKYLFAAVLVTISVIVGLNVYATPDPGKITLTKTATKNYEGADENNLVYGRTAQVNLNVSATPYDESVTTYDQVDIVLVLDGSGSMAYDSTCSGSGSSRVCTSRLQDGKAAATAFINSMMPDGTTNVKIGLVEFGKTVRDVQTLTSSKTTALNFISSSWNATGGTNTQSGIARAKTMLDSDTRENVKKIVIVLTDGIPTYFNYNGSTKGEGDSDKSVCVSDSGSSCTKMSPSDAAKNEMDSLKASYPNADVYTIRFGSESAADAKLTKINSTTNSNEAHKYENLTAIDGSALASQFEHIQENTINAVATNAVVTDIIPAGFKLTDESKIALETAGVTVTSNQDGTTTLAWSIASISATQTGGYNLSYVVEAKDDYHGSMYTNSSAVLTATVNNNPAYEGQTTATESAANPVVEIPAITSNDTYLTNSTYETYETITINGSTVKANDNLTHVENAYGTSTDTLVVVTNDNVVKDGSTYKIYKDGELQGILAMNDNGTFTYNAEAGVTGTVEFQYYIQTNFDKFKETSYVRSKNATVTLNVKPRELKNITVNKTWDDASNQDGKRPASINVTLTGSDGTVKNATITESSWSYVFENLYKYELGHEGDNTKLITYTVTEETVTGYTTNIEGYEITNTHTPEKYNETGDLTVTKVWNDANNQDGLRASYKIQLTGKINVGEENEETVYTSSVITKSKTELTHTFTGLDKYAKGSEIVYEVDETLVPTGYEKSVNGFTITNTHTPETRSVTVTKVWVDANDQDGKRPTTGVTLELRANGTKVQDVTLTPNNVSTDANTWSVTIDGLAKKANGTDIVYTVVENNVPTGYTKSESGLTVTNTHTPEKYNETGDLTVTKVWNDADNQDGLRTSYKIQLTGKINVGKENEETVYTSSVITKSKTELTHTFTGLDKYAKGSEIVYEVDETLVPAGYEKSIDGFTITNTHTPETRSVTVTKVWVDANDQDGIRPANGITLELRANGTKVQDVTLTSNNVTTDANTWSVTIDGLAKKANGTDIVYTVVENNVPAEYTKSESGLTVTNTHEVYTRDITVTKEWDDAEDQDRVRPTSITIRLMNGTTQVDSIVLTSANNWSHTFTELPTNSNGNEINYTVTEDTVTNYALPVITGDMENGFIIKNTHITAKTEVTVTKVWDDDSNRDNIRPNSVTFELRANGTKVQDVTLTQNDVASDSNTWSKTIEGLELNSEGTPIVYTIAETEVAEGYTKSESGLTVTNTHTPEKRNITVTKSWDDNNNQDNTRLETIIVELTIFGAQTGNTVELNEANNWTATFENLKKNANGNEIEYSVSETRVNKYKEPVVTGNMTEGFVVTNEVESYEKTSITVTKTWNDASNQDRVRPESIMIRVWDGQTEVANHAVTGGLTTNTWTYTFENLTKNRAGSPIVYTITEDEVKGYTTSVITGNMTDGFALTNSYTPATRDITVTKVWNDNNNQDNTRKDIVITLVKNGTATDKTVTLSGTKLTDTFTGLDVYEAGVEINYTVSEKQVDRYKAPVITGNMTDGFVITNEVESYETRDITVTKTWNDANNQDGKRPESIMIRVWDGENEVANHAITGESTDTIWTYTFEGLTKNRTGSPIVYTITEDTVEGYTTSTITGNMENGFALTNSYTPEKTSINVRKVWNDNNNQDNTRKDIVITLVKNGTATDKTVTLSGTKLTDTFTGLDVYENGERINYTVSEEQVDKYKKPVVTGNMTDGFVITNEVESYETRDITVTKTWDDADNQDGKRPGSIMIRVWDGQTEVANHAITGGSTNTIWTYTFTGLTKNRAGSEIVYTITEDRVANYTTSEITGNMTSGFTLTNTHTPEKYNETGDLTVTKVWNDADNQDGLRASYKIQLTGKINVGEENEKTVYTSDVITKNATELTHTFSNLYKYAEGSEIVYTVDETDVPTGYEKSVDGFTITNTHTPETRSVTITKVWSDDNNRDAIRPTTGVTLELRGNGTKVQDVTLTPNNVTTDANTWSVTIDGLAKKANGTDIIYTVVENNVPTGYTKSESGLTVTNTHEIDTTTVSGSKTWNDDSNRDRVRPESIVVRLMNGTTEVARKTVTEADGWSYEFTGLPLNENGQAINYTITEDTVEGYTTEINGYNITNTHSIATTTVSGSKTWNDASNQDGIRPESIVVKVMNGATEAARKTVTEADGWSYEFTGLPLNENGQAINYTIAEDTVEGYITTTSGYNITNTHIPELYNTNGELIGKKTWVDANNQDGIRPESIQIQLTATAAGVEIASLSQTATITGTGNDWAYKFEQLPKYNAGNEITYTVTEITNINGYTVSYDEDNEYIIVNTHETSKTSVKVAKEWIDNNNQDGFRPDEIVVRLYANEEGTDKTVTLSESNNWTAEFIGLDEYKEGKVINYTVNEEMDKATEEKYSTKVVIGEDIITIKNTHEIETVDYTVTKTWDDEDNNDGIRPDFISVTLYKNGVATSKTAEITADEEGNWSYTFSNLDKYENGEVITYSVVEDEVSDYESSIKGTVITNTHTPAKISYEITKTWDDNDDQDGKRPEIITVYLYKNGEVVNSRKLSEENEWKASFENLYKFENGELVEYVVVEEEVKGYTEIIDTSDIDENNIIRVGITNVHVPETIEININKTWDDTDNKYNTRPENITVNIYADDEIIETVTIDSTTNWTYSITVDKYANKKEITYTIVEDDVYGYEAIYNGFDILNTYVLGTGGDEYLVQTGSEINTKVISALSLVLSSLVVPLLRKKRLN